MNVPKTPVSILQEMMVKKKMIPSYELIHNGGGTHQNIFTYKITCDGLTATGTGRCKKDAKHEAASAMLEAIAKHQSLPQLPASPCESPVRTPLPMTIPVCPKSPPNVPFRNAIGELQELCLTNNLENPVYKEIGDIGPPHARVFTTQCIVSTFLEEGIATTKKQAKHLAAKKMILRISGVVSDDLINDVGNDKVNETKEQISSKAAMVKYPQLASEIHPSEHVRSRINWGLKVINFHKRLRENFDDQNRDDLLSKIESLLTLLQLELSFEQAKQEFDELVKSIDLAISQNEFECDKEKEKNFAVGIQLNSAPDIHEIGLGKTKEDAGKSALNKVLDTMKFLLK